MPHEPGHVFDPYNLSPEEEKARRLLRQAEDALAPAAMRGQLGERGPLQEFLIEQADEIKNITGAKRARITNPDAFGAFLAGRSDEFEEFTGRPSPMRQAMLAEEGALSPTGMPERPGERGLSKMEKVELAAFAASPLLMGMAPYFASEIGAELMSEGVERLPSWVPTPVTTGLEGVLAATALKRGRLTPKTAALGFSVGAGIGDVAEQLGFGEQAEQLGAFLSGGLTGDAVTGFGFRGPTLFAGGGRTADPTGVRLPSGRVSDPSATAAAIRNLPQRFEQFAAAVGRTGVGNVLQPTPPVQQAARAADDVTGGGLNARIRSREAERVARTADAEQDFIPFHGDQIVDRGPQDLNTGSGRLTASRQALDRGNSAGAAVLKAQEDVISNFTDRGDPRAVFLRGGMGKEFGDIYAREVARLDALDLPTDVAARARVIANEPGAVSADEFMRAINGQTELAPRPQRGPNPDVQSVIGEIPPSPATPDVAGGARAARAAQVEELFDELDEIQKAQREAGEALRNWGTRLNPAEEALEGATREERLAVRERNIASVKQLKQNIKDLADKNHAIQDRLEEFTPEELGIQNVDRPATPDVPPVRPVQGGFEGVAGDVARPTAEQPGMTQASFMGETATQDAAIAAELARRGGQVPRMSRADDPFQKQLDDAQADIDYAKSTNDYTELARAENELDVLLRAGDDPKAQAILRQENEIARLKVEVDAAQDTALNIPGNIRQAYFAGWSDDKIIAFARSEQRDVLQPEWYDQLDPVAIRDFGQTPNSAFGTGTTRSALQAELVQARADLRELKGLPERKRPNQAPLTPGEPVTIIRSNLKTKTGKNRVGGKILLQKADGSRRSLTQDEYDRFNAGEAVDDVSTPVPPPVRAADAPISATPYKDYFLARAEEIARSKEGRPAVAADVPPVRVGEIPASVTSTDAAQANYKLPEDLKRSNVNWGVYGNITDYFESDFDRALVIATSQRPSKRRTTFVKEIERVLGRKFTQRELNELAAPLRARITEIVRGGGTSIPASVRAADQAVPPVTRAAAPPPIRQSQRATPEQREVVANENARKAFDRATPPPPRKPGTPVGTQNLPEPDRSDIGFLDEFDVPTHERITTTVARRMEGARNDVQLELEDFLKTGDDILRESGLNPEKLTFAETRAIFEVLHNERALSDLEPRFHEIVAHARALRDAEQTQMLQFLNEAAGTDVELLMVWDMRTMADRMMVIPDYFPRMWKQPDDASGLIRRRGFAATPASARSRVDMTFSDLVDEVGLEPVSANPIAMMAQRRLEGVFYREQIRMAAILKRAGKMLPEGEAPEGWRVPDIRSAVFNGKPTPVMRGNMTPDQLQAIDAWVNTGGRGGFPGEIGMTSKQAVPSETASFLETIFGVRRRHDFPLPFGREVDLAGMLDSLTNGLKRTKVFGSWFQHMDISKRAFGGRFAAQRTTLGTEGIAGIPSLAARLIKSAWLPSERTALRTRFRSTVPIVKDAKNSPSRRMLVQEGLNIQGDITLIRREATDAVQSVIKESSVPVVGRALKNAQDIVRFLESGLFDGVYRTGMEDTAVNFIVPQLVREHPEWTARRIAAEAAEIVNTQYSALGLWQSVFKDPGTRRMLQWLIFSTNESEALIRQVVKGVGGPNRGIWGRWFLGIFWSLAVYANAINLMATGRPLPPESYVPVNVNDPYAPFRVGYSSRFLSPQIPFIKGRNGEPLYLDVVGQMDTAIRWAVDPMGALAARVNVIPRAAINQARGQTFFGEQLDSREKRAFQLAMDIGSPIAGQSLAQIPRETIPGAEEIIPTGEERIGIPAAIVQAFTGENIRGSTTKEVLDRGARELVPTASGYDDLEIYQKDDLRLDSPVSDELRLRGEEGRLRGSEFAETFGRVDEIDAERFKEEQKLYDQFKAREIGLTELRRKYFTLQTFTAGKREERYSDLDLEQQRPDELELNKAALQEYYDVFETSKTQAEQDRLLGDLERKLRNNGTWEYVLRNTNRRKHPDGLIDAIGGNTKKNIDASEAARDRHRSTLGTSSPQQPAAPLKLIEYPATAPLKLIEYPATAP